MNRPRKESLSKVSKPAGARASEVRLNSTYLPRNCVFFFFFLDIVGTYVTLMWLDMLVSPQITSGLAHVSRVEGNGTKKACVSVSSGPN